MALSTRWTKNQLIAISREYLLDPNSKYWTDTELGGYVDQWQHRVQEAYELIWGTSTTTTTASQGTLAVPSDCLRPDAIYWNDQRLVQRTVEELDIADREFRLITDSTPYVWYQPYGTSTINFFPIPTAVGTVISEYPKLLTFAAGTSTTELPAWCKYTATHYVLYRAYLRHGPNQDVNRAAKYKRLWDADTVKLGSFKTAYFPTKYLALRPVDKYEIDILQPRGSVVRSP